MIKTHSSYVGNEKLYKIFFWKPQHDRFPASYSIMDSLTGGGFHFRNNTNP
jgi:hypothetical protein